MIISLGEICKFKYGTGYAIPIIGGKYPVYGSNGVVGLTTHCRDIDGFDALVNDISVRLPAEIEARRKQ
jgi:hypothetical protein